MIRSNRGKAPFLTVMVLLSACGAASGDPIETIFGGNVTFGSAARLEIELAGATIGPPTEYDRLLIGGTATLGGMLELLLINDFRQSISGDDTFSVMTTIGGIFGEWANVQNGQRLGLTSGTGDFLVSYGAGSAFDSTQLVLSDFRLPVFAVTWLGGTGSWTDDNWSSGSNVAFPDNSQSFDFDFHAIVDTGTVTLDQNIALSKLSLEGGTIDGIFDLTTDTLNWTAGTLAGGTGASITVSGGSLSGGSFKSLSRELINTGVLEWQEGDIATFGTGDGILRNQDTLNITGTSDRLSFQSDIVFFNETGATITKSDSAHVAINSDLENDGQLNVTGGTLWIKSHAGDGSDGDFTVSSGAILEFQPFLTHTIRGNVTGGGEVMFIGRTTNFEDNATIDNVFNVATVVVTGADANINTTQTAQIATLKLQGSAGSDFGGTADINVTNPLTWTGGNLVGGTETLITIPGGTLSGSSGKGLSRKLINTGTLEWQEGDITSLGTGDGILRNQATLNITGTSDRITFQSGFVVINEAGATITKSDSADVALNSDLENDGQPNVTGGTLRIKSHAGDGSDGDFTVSTGAILEFQPFTTHTIRGNVTGGGEVMFIGGTTNFERTTRRSTTCSTCRPLWLMRT